MGYQPHRCAVRGCGICSRVLGRGSTQVSAAKRVEDLAFSLAIRPATAPTGRSALSREPVSAWELQTRQF